MNTVKEWNNKIKAPSKSDWSMGFHRIFERNRRIFGEAVLLSNVHKYFSYLILKGQISDKNY